MLLNLLACWILPEPVLPNPRLWPPLVLFVTLDLAFILLLRRRLLFVSGFLFSSESSFSKLAISTTMSSASPLRSWIPDWVGARNERAPPKSVSTTMFSKSISVLACCRARRYFFAIRIILRVYHMHHITISPSSLASSKPFTAPVFEKSVTRKTILQTMTTIPSKIFHQRVLPFVGSLTYFWIPTSFMRHPKSIPMSKFKRNSITMNAGLSATWNPSKIVIRMRPKLNTSKPM